MIIESVQDHYPDDVAICYGCGKHNPQGLHIKTRWDGKEGVFRFTPEPYHSAFPGVVYGGLIASLIDCHAIGTAIAATYEAEGRPPDTEPNITYVTGNLNVTYLHPTPAGVELELRAQVEELHEKKAIVICSLYADGIECAKGVVVAIRIASRFNPKFA
jgi:acyl-coenzyme A thioesterase PaaI-like protein